MKNRRRSISDRVVRDLAALVPIPWNRDEFFLRLGAWLGKPVYSLGRRMPPGTHALMAELSGHYEIYFDKHDTANQIMHDVLHEVGHIVLKHALLVIVPTQHIPGTCPYPAELQREAEDLAVALFTRIMSISDHSSLVLNRVAAMLQ